MSLEVNNETNESMLTIKLLGVMDYSTIDGFELNIPEHIKNVSVDFSNLEFIDSTGIGAILLIIHEAHARGAALEFEGLNEAVKELFDTVGVFRILESLRKRGQ